MHKFPRTLLYVLLAACGLTVPVAAQETTDAGVLSPQRRLATEFARAAVSRLAFDPLTLDALQMGVGFITEATALDPDTIEYWQTALNIAQMAENETLKTRAIERLNTLDPGHELARLMRLNAALDRYQVFEERKAAYEQLLTTENLPRIGEAIASRLALDLALLHQRRGEIDEFSRWLTRAVTWDRSNRTAAAIAAGFFRSQVDDPAAVAELLVNLLLADPTDVNAQVDLAQLLLEHGAFNGAHRLYRVASNALREDHKMPATGMVVDHAVAMWGRGLDDLALETLERRQYEMDHYYRIQLKQQRPETTPEELLSVRLLDQGLATVAAVIRTSRSDSGAAPAAQMALAACLGGIQALTENAASAAANDPAAADRIRADLAQKYLETAWIALWLGIHTDQVQGLIDSAAQQQPLSPEANDRFAGWLAFRTGELDKAVELLQPLAGNDLAARLGLAHVLNAQGKPREAAREFLAVHRAQPGSVIGIWAAARLKDIVGQSPGPTEEAAAMERLVASIPTHFDRSIEDPTLAMNLRLALSKQTYEPYEPIRATLQLTNMSMYPLALDRNGPIRPQVLVVPSVRSAQANRSGQLRSFIIDIGHKLRLMPRETLTVHLDLRNYWPGEAINGLAVNGALVKLRMFLNFAVNADGVPVAGLYGIENEAPLTRVDGQRITREWVDQALSMMSAGTGGDHLLQTMAMFSHFVAPPAVYEATLEERQFLDSARITFAEAFAKLDGVCQAWLLCVMPRGSREAIEGLQSTLAIARQSPDRLVTIAYLAFHADGSNDPMFDAALRSDDAKLRALAEAMRADIRLREDASQR